VQKIIKLSVIDKNQGFKILPLILLRRGEGNNNRNFLSYSDLLLLPYAREGGWG
jgi:hypothetical protein